SGDRLKEVPRNHIASICHPICLKRLLCLFHNGREVKQGTPEAGISLKKRGNQRTIASTDIDDFLASGEIIRSQYCRTLTRSRTRHRCVKYLACRALQREIIESGYSVDMIERRLSRFCCVERLAPGTILFLSTH